MTVPISRRAALGAVGGAGAAALTADRLSAHAPSAPADARPAKTGTIARTDRNIVETAHGKVRGSEHDGIHVFRGIPYGADTGGKARFLPARPADDWTGVRSALWFGNVCPSPPRENWKDDERAFLFRWDDGQPGEDCLRANVWTPGLSDGAKRPVMVWVHGGGFFSGSGQEQRSYDGENLSRRGDVVVVTFNHRLGVFGFLDLSGNGSADHAGAGNVGMTDIVLLLRWVRDNIAAFGGDPANVTVFGQSGGGGKISTLLAMPSARGLFHKAAVQSGSMLRINTPAATRKLAEASCDILGIGRNDIVRLTALPAETLLRAGSAAQARVAGSLSAAPDARQIEQVLGWGPYVDGTIIPHQPFDRQAPDTARDVPMLIGNVLNEFVTGIGNPDAFAMTEAQLTEKVTARYGASAPKLLAAFRSAHPRANPFQLFSIINARSFRVAAVKQAQMKATQGSAPAYLYWFQWQTPILDGRPMAFHSSELAFVFDNIERCEMATGSGADARRLAAQMSDAWISFARTGRPGHAGLPAWPAVRSGGAQTMIFDTISQFRDDPDPLEREAFDALPY